MNYITTASTDVGIRKKTNQDSLFVRTLNTKQGKMVFAVICDGMGGLSKGEVASAALIRAFTEWMTNSLPVLSQKHIEDQVIKSQWDAIIVNQNEIIKYYGKNHGVRLGTTITAMLMTDRRYYILNVGDTRAYEISSELKQLTNDQTVVAREIALGNMTQEEAHNHPSRNVLLQCVGASEHVYPDMFFGETRHNVVYMLCSDGFRHEITPGEIHSAFEPAQMLDADIMKQRTDSLIDLNKLRNEEDNISVVTIRTF